MIAIALSCSPKLLIADEPTTALDVTIQAQILNLINQLKQDFDASVLLITHDLGVVSEMAQNVSVMYAGNIVEYANVVELFSNSKHPYTQGLLNSIPKMGPRGSKNRILKTIPGVVPSLFDLPTGCAFYDRCSQQMDKCRGRFPQLIEIDTGHTVRCWLYD
jgi:oligopeptide/dipeptide ABC transporter ATP-binding protein